jgi:hypothetical protein
VAVDIGFRIMNRVLKRKISAFFGVWHSRGDPRRQFFIVGDINKSEPERRVLFEINKTRGTYGPRTATIEANVERHNRVLQFDGVILSSEAG